MRDGRSYLAAITEGISLISFLCLLRRHFSQQMCRRFLYPRSQSPTVSVRLMRTPRSWEAASKVAVFPSVSLPVHKSGVCRRSSIRLNPHSAIPDAGQWDRERDSEHEVDKEGRNLKIISQSSKWASASNHSFPSLSSMGSLHSDNGASQSTTTND